jgi:hypothetical protein
MNWIQTRNIKRLHKKKLLKKSLEAPGFEPGAFRMRSGHSTTELCPHGKKMSEIRESEHFRISYRIGFYFIY